MNLIVAADENWAIGNKNELLVRIPADQKFFRETTMGKVVVMGRKTLETFPNGLPLMGRTNIVLTHDKKFRVPGALIVHDMEELHEELKEFVYGPTSFSSSYAMKLVKGGSIGDIYGKAFVRDDAGNIVYGTEGDNTGMPLVEGDGNTVKVGNANPKLMLGWNHMLSYKNFSFYFLVDCRFGGDILSQTQADMDMYGVSEVTARARDKGYVMLEGNRIDNVKGFYKNVVGGRAGVTEYYMYDATNIRLRELSVGYQLPAAWMEKTKVLKRAQLSFSGRNLFFFYKKAPFDPDLVLSTGNDNQGIEVYGMPTTRSWGFSLKCEF